MFGFSKAGEGEGGWTSAVVVASIIIGLIALVLFALRQNVMREPMMNLRVFKYPMYIVGLVLVLACMMIILSSMIILPMFLQNGMGQTAFAAGLMLLPGSALNGSALNGILSPRMGRLFDKYGPRGLVISGLVIVAVALWFFSDISIVSSVAFLVTLHIGLMVGISMVWMPAQTNGLNQLPPELYPHGTAIMNTLQQVAGAIGTAVAISILTGGMQRYLHGSSAPTEQVELAKALTFGSQNVFTFAMIITLIGLTTAFFIRRVIVNHEMTHSSH